MNRSTIASISRISAPLVGGTGAAGRDYGQGGRDSDGRCWGERRPDPVRGRQGSWPAE
jgi:hypothetical protein